MYGASFYLIFELKINIFENNYKILVICIAISAS